MVYSDPKIDRLSGGWYAVYKDGKVVTQEEGPWCLVTNKKNIQILGIKKFNKCYELIGKENYLPPGETHCRELCVNPGTGIAVTKQTLVGWYIGYCEKDGKVILRINAKDKQSWIEKVPFNKEVT